MRCSEADAACVNMAARATLLYMLLYALECMSANRSTTNELTNQTNQPTNRTTNLPTYLRHSSPWQPRQNLASRLLHVVLTV